MNEGVVLGIREGRISSASALVNFDASSEALGLAKTHAIDIGWHINLTLGQPVSDPRSIPSLVTTDGYFHSLPSLLIRSFWGKIKREDVARELGLQYEAFTKAGLRPSHADGHQHVHVFPMIRDVVGEIARREKIPFVRVPAERGSLFLPRRLVRLFFHLITVNLDFGVPSVPFYGFTLGNKTHGLEAWASLLDRIEADKAEVMVHPAKKYADDDYHGDDFPGDREAELRLLTSPEFGELLGRKNWVPCSFV